MPSSCVRANCNNNTHVELRARSCFVNSIIRIMASSSSASKEQGKKSKQSKSKERGSKAPRSEATNPPVESVKSIRSMNAWWSWYMHMHHQADACYAVRTRGGWNGVAVHEEVQLRGHTHMHLRT